MISFIEEQSGNVRVVTESGTKYMPTGSGWRLLGFDRDTFCFQWPNGQLSVYDEQCSHQRLLFLDPNRNTIRSYNNGAVYFRDDQMGINYRLDVASNQRFQMV